MRPFGKLAMIGAVLLGGAGVAACASDLPPITPVAHVDLPRYMGKWYVIATIPTVFEKHAFNAVETYTLQPDGNIHTTFRFNNGAFDGPVKHIQSTGYVHAGSGNAVWGVKLFWGFKAQYKVAWLKPDYSQVIVARDKRDYTWVMARSPHVADADYAALVARVKAMGYDVTQLRKVPQK
jgi:apolipoprotein D and lipocalin family protein